MHCYSLHLVLQADWHVRFLKIKLSYWPIALAGKPHCKAVFWNLRVLINQMKLLDYLKLLLLLLLQGRGELESLLRKALLRSVLGRAKLRQHYRRRGKQAS